MTLTIDHEVTLSERVSMLQLVDTDIHNDLPSMEALRPFLAKKWHPWLDSGGPGSASCYYANMGSGRMDDAVNEEDGLAAGDPEWVIQQLMTKYRIDIGILTGMAKQGIPQRTQPGSRRNIWTSAVSIWQF